MKARLLTTALLLAVAVPASAQFSKPEDAIRYRQSAYVLMGNHMGRIFAQLKSDKPDVAAIQKSAAIVDFASQLPGEGYVPGSDKGGTPPTKAKPEVFTDPKVRDVGRAMRAGSGQAGRSVEDGRRRRHPHPVPGDRQVVRQLPRQLPQQVSSRPRRSAPPGVTNGRRFTLCPAASEVDDPGDQAGGQRGEHQGAQP